MSISTISSSTIRDRISTKMSKDHLLHLVACLDDHHQVQELYPSLGETNLISPGLIRDVCACAQSLQPCLTLCDPMDCSLQGSSVHGILQARILEWIAISSSRGIFSTQGSNPSLQCLLPCKQILYFSSNQWQKNSEKRTCISPRA